MKADSVKIEITLKSLILILIFILGITALWELRLVFIFLLFSFIVNSALRAYVDYFQTKRIPRIASTVFIFLTLFLILSLMTVTVFSETVEQFKNLVMLMPQLLTNILSELFLIFPWLKDLIDLQEFKTQFLDELTSAGGIFSSGISSAYNILNSAITTLGGVVTITMLSIYMLVRKQEIYSSLINFLPISNRQKLKYNKKLMLVEEKLGEWVRAQLFMMGFIGVLTWVGLVTPSIFFESYQMNQYALPISFIAAILEAIPTLGPIATAVIAIIIALGSGSSLGTVIFIVILFYLIQQLEATLIFPNVMA
ncbi:MAG TPA: AI-2E family transporter, partial [Candidatus Dojkabacteria bacterium]|nr:AI-2E family transporter [Candidatus Dojkabacteria bacterium]